MTTIPCRADPDAWDLPAGILGTLDPTHAQRAVKQAAVCATCPVLADCNRWRTASPVDHRCVQAGQIYEPGTGWLSPDAWLRRARMRRCGWCGALTRNGLYCGMTCAGHARMGQPRPRTAPAAPPGCPGTGLHGTVWAFRQHNCRCPESVRLHETAVARSYARKVERNGYRPRRRVDLALIRAMHASGDDPVTIAKKTGLHVDTVRRHLQREIAAKRANAEAAAQVLIAAGVSTREISRQVGLGRLAVDKVRLALMGVAA